MNTLWGLILIATCTIAILTEQETSAAAAMLSCGQGALHVFVTLAGSMIFWGGMLEILSRSGDVERLGKALRRVLRPLFPGVEDDACWAAMGVNLAANIMGLGNAATPAGIRAAQLLASGGEAGLRGLAMLLALNNAGLQLMPTTVIALRASNGAAEPASIWPATLLASCAAAITAALLMSLVQRGGRRHG